MEIKHVSKSFGNVKVLDDVSFSVEQGSITCILGESGAGKTTLLQAISSLVPFEGKIENVGELSYIFQSPRLLPNLTVRQNLELVLPKEKWGEISTMLSLVSLSDKECAYPNTLSGGQAQRVSIARAFLYPADTILMDEPFSSLDLSLKIKLIDLFVSLWKRDKKTVLFVTHDVEEATMLAQKVIILKKGKIVTTLLEAQSVPRIYGSPSTLRDRIVSSLLENDN